MLAPKKQKYRKQFRRRKKTVSSKATTLSFGDYGLKALELSVISANQIEAARIAIARATKRSGKIWIRIFPDKPITKKPAGSRMGAGKGDLAGYVAPVTPGRIILEIAGVSREIAQEALNRAAHKLSVKTKFIAKE